jgi:hypothetical protein
MPAGCNSDLPGAGGVRTAGANLARDSR